MVCRSGGLGDQETESDPEESKQQQVGSEGGGKVRKGERKGIGLRGKEMSGERVKWSCQYRLRFNEAVKKGEIARLRRGVYGRLKVYVATRRPLKFHQDQPSSLELYSNK